MSKQKSSKNLYDSIDLIPVDSSRIEGIGYDPETQILVIKFNKGGTYAYHNCDRQLFENFKNHPSKGKYFEVGIKDNPNLETVKVHNK